MLVRVKDRRDRDSQLRKGALSPLPEHLKMQLINFVKREYNKPFNVDIGDKKKVIRQIVSSFLKTSPNLKSMFGKFYVTFDTYFTFEEVLESAPPKEQKQSELNFKEFF